MKKLLFILAIFFIGFQNISAQKNIENKKDSVVEKKDSVYALPDVRAEFKGGDNALIRFLSSEIKYPEIALNDGVQHKFLVNFVICKDGSVCDIEVLDKRKLDKFKKNIKYKESVALLKNEAIRVVKATNGKWNAATKDGEKVNCYFTLPITFKLVK